MKVPRASTPAMLSDPASNGADKGASSRSADPLEPSHPLQALTHEVTARKVVPVSAADILEHSVRGGLRAFLIGYGVRGAFTLILRILAVARGRRLVLKSLLGDSLLNVECLRYGAATGGFSLLWKAINNSLRVYRGGDDSRINGAIAGAVASLSLMALPRGIRTGLNVQLLLRALQLLYVYHKSRGRVHLPHGDCAVFALACGQIMYSAIMRPDALPRSYYHWIKDLSQVHSSVLNLNRKIARDNGVLSSSGADLSELASMLGASQATAAAVEHGAEAALSQQLASGLHNYVVPCSLFHPTHANCNYHHLTMVVRVFYKMLPLNLALNLAPMIVLKFGDFLKSPLSLLKKGSQNSARSSLFLAVYCALVQAVICAHRAIHSRSGTAVSTLLAAAMAHRITYWLGGVVAGGVSIYIEQKRRRSELMLYVLPKTLESVYAVLLSRRVLKSSMPAHADMVAGAAACAVLMGWYQTHREFLNPMLRGVLGRLLGDN